MRIVTVVQYLCLSVATATTCPTLEELFRNNALYEHNLNDYVAKSTHLVGDRDESAQYIYEDPGDQDLWYDNPLSYEMNNIDTVAVGTSSGVCNLLPPNGNTSQCLTIFTFEYGTLVMSSLWPNSIQQRGELIIIGGTDCFEGAVGTISVLAMDETWEYFEYQLIEEKKDDTCHDVNLMDFFNATVDPPVLYEVQKNDTFLPAWSSSDDGPKMGDRDLWHQNFLSTNIANNDTSNQVGVASGSCTWLHHDDICIGFETFTLDGAGKITQVMFNTSGQEIVGGTDCFLGEKGRMGLTSNVPGIYQFSLQNEVDRWDCVEITLKNILHVGMIEHTDNDVILSADGDVGTGNTVGDTVFWINNPVRIELAYERQIGRTIGMCTVLPVDGSVSLCLVKLHLDRAKEWNVMYTEADFGGGSITFIGLVPNEDDKPGLMAVVSGTGCFSDPAAKSLYYTRKEGGSYYTIGSVDDSGLFSGSRNIKASVVGFASLVLMLVIL
jgi:hypothetical protein